MMPAPPRPSRPGRGIQARVMILVTAGLVTTLALLSYASWRAVASLRHDLDLARQRVAASIAHHLDTGFGDALASLQGLAATARACLGENLCADADRAFREAYLQSPLFEGVLLLDQHGRALVAAPAGAVDPAAPEAAAAIAEALAAVRPSVSDLLPAGGGGYRVLLVVPVTDWQQQLIGLTAGVIDPSSARFSAFAQPLSEPDGISIDVLDGGGRVVTSNDDAVRFSAAGPDQAGPEATGAPLRLARWRVVVHTTGHGRAAPERSLVRTLAWLTPLLVALSLLFGWGAGRSVRRPLLALTAATERIAAGDLDQPVPPSGEDEVGRLGRAFERMRVALKASLDEINAANEALERRVEDRTRELATANRALQERERARQQLLRKVISAQEDERKRLARELHDETSQTLTALSVRLETALANTPQEPARTHVAEARALASRSLDELQRLMHDLRPSVLDDLGLVSAIRWYAERHLASRGISVRFEASPPDLRLPYDLETALFRATQEILTNVARHADADMVLIQLSAHEGRLSLEVEDDGRGFNPAEVKPSPTNMRGLGLMGIRERVELFDGSVEFDSSPGQGTRVAINVPLPPGASHGEDPRPHR